MISSEVQEITNFISFLFIEHKWMLHAFSDHRGDARISMKLTFALLVSDNNMTLKKSVMHEKLPQKQCCLWIVVITFQTILKEEDILVCEVLKKKKAFFPFL